MIDNPFEIEDPFKSTEAASTTTTSPPNTTDADPFASIENPKPMANENPFASNRNLYSNNMGNTKRKYKFVQMYLLINNKLFANQSLNNESGIMEISYNVDYGNLRLSFCSPNQNTFDRTSIKIQNMERQTTINIYPEVAENILHSVEQWKTNQFQIFERMIQSSANWSPNSSIVRIDGNNKSVAIHTKASNGNAYMYIFTDWQLNALINSLKFLVNGVAWNLDLARFLTQSND